MCCCANRGSFRPGSIGRTRPARHPAPASISSSAASDSFCRSKGIYQLIQAFALAKSVQPMLRLKLLNSLYAIEASTEYAHQCMRLIGEKHLRGDVHVSTAFLDHEETLRELGDSDLVVLPYLYSTESSSAAGAFAIASLRPVLCSDLSLFDELADVIHRFPGR